MGVLIPPPPWSCISQDANTPERSIQLERVRKHLRTLCLFFEFRKSIEFEQTSALYSKLRKQRRKKLNNTNCGIRRFNEKSSSSRFLMSDQHTKFQQTIQWNILSKNTLFVQSNCTHDLAILVNGCWKEIQLNDSPVISSVFTRTLCGACRQKFSYLY